jgi:hypothetical protein
MKYDKNANTIEKVLMHLKFKLTKRREAEFH